MARKRRRKDVINHRVLSLLYPSSSSSSSTGVSTLHDFVLDLLCIQESTAAMPVHSLLVRDDDPADYLSLLHQGYAVLPSSSPCPGTSMTSEQRWTLQQVIERVIQLQFRQGNNASHVLCFGFQKPRPRCVNKVDNMAPAGLHFAFDNVAVRLLSSHAWTILHSRVGDRLMLYILSYADIYHPLPNGCLIQVAGASIISTARAYASSYWSKNIIGHRANMNLGVIKKEDGFQKSNDSCNGLVNVSAEVEVEQSNFPFSNIVLKPPKKRSRPFSWQRRKSQKFCPEKKETKMFGEMGSMEVLHQIEVGDVHAKRSMTTNHGVYVKPTRGLLHNVLFGGSNCSKFKAGTRLINRKQIFYKAKFSQHPGLPKNHILRKLHLTDDGVTSLCETIFGKNRQADCPKRCSKSIFYLCRKLLQNSRDCQYARLLERHCPSVKNSKPTTWIKGSGGENVWVNSHNEVVAFIWAVCRRIVPEEFLGSKCDWRALRKNIFSFVSLRKEEQFTLEQCILNIRLSGYSWCQGMCCPSGNSDVNHFDSGRSSFTKWRIDYLARWVYWLFSFLVVPLIEAHFYVSESEIHRQDVLFYRKPVWSRMKANALREMARYNLKKLKKKSAMHLLQQGSLGYSQVRLLPKRTGMRLIANLGSPSSLPSDISSRNARISRKGKMWTCFKPINYVLRDVHHCLKFEQENHAGDMGCSVFDYNDIYLKILPFIKNFKKGPKATRPFIVVCDVSQAFDNIKQEKLIDILHDFVREQEYFIKRYSCITPTAKTVKIVHYRIAAPTDADKDIQNRDQLEFTILPVTKLTHAVCIDQAYATRLKQSEIFCLLEEHLLRNILQIGPHFYLQVIGIPQGSILSSLLCSIYYGHLEKHRLLPSLLYNDALAFASRHRASEVDMPLSQENGSCQAIEGHPPSKPRSILLRLIDDWLFISDAEATARGFISMVHRGFADYNCAANKLKTALNFSTTPGVSLVESNVYHTEDGACYIKWTGLLINCNTLEVQADYTRYCGVDLRSTLTIWRHNNQGSYLQMKLYHFVRPKCHPLFYDLNINSPSTAFLNAYQAFLLCAMKFHAFKRSLLCSSTDSHFYLKMIRQTARYLWPFMVVEPVVLHSCPSQEKKCPLA